MEQFAWTIAGAVGGIGAFWIIIRYVLNRLDGKVDKDVFDQYCLRVSDNLENGKRRFDKIDAGMKELTDAVNRMSNEITQLCTIVDSKFNKAKK